MNTVKTLIFIISTLLSTQGKATTENYEYWISSPMIYNQEREVVDCIEDYAVIPGDKNNVWSFLGVNYSNGKVECNF